eukprot:TRINITY_DN29199_c0_g1_i2.p1 TRINITY_DN29199_c0_g1~~TRINITY_DN29199_c0_g1_i2.p1  ORF type:complete len:639 (-),score=106.68 TRINITY_DN29199_c0_g1_i2:1249-3165(-)
MRPTPLMMRPPPLIGDDDGESSPESSSSPSMRPAAPPRLPLGAALQMQSEQGGGPSAVESARAAIGLPPVESARAAVAPSPQPPKQMGTRSVGSNYQLGRRQSISMKRRYSTAGEAITTGARVRPPSITELSGGDRASATSCVRIEPPGRVLLTDPARPSAGREFECDFAFDSSDPLSPQYADQKAVFDGIGSQVVDDCLKGLNCCLCAYGQTGTGKTHTLLGDWSSEANAGLLPRISEALFEKLDELIETDVAEAVVQISYFEIHNNKLRDLLLSAAPNGVDIAGSRSPSAAAGAFVGTPLNVGNNAGDMSPKFFRRQRLEIHAHPELGVYIENLSEFPVRSHGDVGRLVAIGERERSSAATSMNKQSSRSHAIFMFRLDMDRKGGDPQALGNYTSTVQVVDLAGRENEQTSECEGERFRELTFINRSLFQLANCVHALTDGSRGHVPFRNSKLTTVLSQGFQDNSRTILLATLTPSVVGFEENLFTCRFLESTGRIETRPVVNRISVEELRDKMQVEIDAMRDEIRNAQGDLPMDSPRFRLLDGRARAESDGMTQTEVSQAADRAGASLNGASNALKRLDKVHESINSSLERAEGRLLAVEEAVRKLGCKTSPSKPPEDRRGVTFEVSVAPVILLS